MNFLNFKEDRKELEVFRKEYRKESKSEEPKLIQNRYPNLNDNRDKLLLQFKTEQNILLELRKNILPPRI